MRILFLTRRFWPEIGGVEKHCLEVGKRLMERGNEITVISEEDCFSLDRLGITMTRKDGIDIYRIPVTVGERLKKFQIWWWLAKNINLIKEADIVQCHDVFFWYLPFRFLFPFKKVFTTFHGWEGVFPPSKKAIWVRKLSEKLSRGNICVGKFIEKWYGTKTDYIVYGGINLVKSLKCKVKNYSSKLKAIIFVGRTSRDNGIDIYLKALEKLRDNGTQWTITFLGDGERRKEAEKYGKVMGFVKDINPYLEKADFVFASSYLSILEAMAKKKLVFSVYQNPLKKDYFKLSPLSSLLITTDNVDDLAGKIRYYCKHPNEAEKLVEKAYSWVKEQSWDKITDIYLRLWKN